MYMCACYIYINYIYIYIYINIYIYVSMYVCVCVCVYVCMYVCMFCMYVCMYVCMYLYVCILARKHACSFLLRESIPTAFSFFFFYPRLQSACYYYILRGVFRYFENLKGVGVICAGIDERTRLH